MLDAHVHCLGAVTQIRTVSCNLRIDGCPPSMAGISAFGGRKSAAARRHLLRQSQLRATACASLMASSTPPAAASSLWLRITQAQEKLSTRLLLSVRSPCPASPLSQELAAVPCLHSVPLGRQQKHLRLLMLQLSYLHIGSQCVMQILVQMPSVAHRLMVCL